MCMHWVERLRQHSEVSAANCRKPCFTAPFMEAGILAQSLLPTGQFLRKRPAGRFSVHGDVPGESPPATLTQIPSLPALAILLPSLPPSEASSRRAHAARATDAAEGGLNVPAPACAPPRPPVGRSGLGAPPAALAPTPQHTSAAAGGAGEGKAPGGRPGLPAGRGGAHAGLASRAFSSRRPPGGRARRVTLGGGSAAPFPSLAAPGPAGAPPVRLCGGLLDYVCPLRAPALAAGWRWGGKTTRRRRRRRRRWRGGGGSQQGHGS